MNIAFIGLGAMGSAMVERLLHAGYNVSVFNRTHKKVTPLVKLGAKDAISIIEACSNADVVMTCLFNDEAVLAATQGIVSQMKQGAIHIGLSTTLPSTSETLLDIHQKAKTHFLSAVVLGVPTVAREGKLAIFCAGEKEAFTKATPLLSTFSSSISLLGDETQIKAPSLIKICMNYSLMVALELMSELFVFAEINDLDKEIVKKGLQQIYGHPAFKRYIDKIAERDFDEVHFSMAGGQRDAHIFKQVFANSGVTTELSNLLNERYEMAMSQGLHNKDWGGIYEIVRKQSNLVD